MRSGQARPCVFGLLCVPEKTGDAVEELACGIEPLRHLPACRRHFECQPCIGIEAGSVPLHFVGKRRDFRCKRFFFGKWYFQPGNYLADFLKVMPDF